MGVLAWRWTRDSVRGENVSERSRCPTGHLPSSPTTIDDQVVSRDIGACVGGQK